ncbi:MAG: hypothetical protein M3296_09185 [Actinomycetota bacterium]|nr:hypothetical protein [Actinomycetota bacterium]
MARQIDLSNVQGTVVHLYRRPIVRHLLLHFTDAQGGRAFLRELAPTLTMADAQPDSLPDPLVNVGLTFSGLGALRVDPRLLDKFDTMYKGGPDANALGDVAGSDSDPANWWEGRFTTPDVHCIVHLYLRTDAAVEPASAKVRDAARRFSVSELIPRRDGTVLDARSLGGAKLHFGYTDGISHPDISWQDVPDDRSQIDFRNFLLGYSTADHGSAPATGPAADLVRDSTYAAFRWIYQDVAAFNQVLSTHGPRLFPRLSPADAEELLAAKMLGRWRDGTPLVLSPEHPDPGLTRSNDFGYASEDPRGLRCPFSAHIRVVNPRDQPLDPIVEAIPKVIRRGMPYGPPLQSAQDDGQDRGIIGIFLCADIRRQIYTLTRWIKRNDFSPVYDANRRRQDAVVANRAVPGADAGFSIPGDAGDATIPALPDLVRTKGTALLLYPSRSTLGGVAGDA